MPATRLLDRSDAAEELADVLDRAEAHFGHLPALVKALANNPAMCRTITDFLITSLGPGRIDWGLKQLVILKTLRSIKSYYGYGAHEKLALDLGVDADKVGDIANSLWRDSPHFTDSERALLEYVEQIGRDPNDVAEELWDRLRSHWDAGQLLEVSSVVTTFIMIGRLGDALGVVDAAYFSKELPRSR